MDEITIVNNIFVENLKFTESQEEIKRRKAAVDCFDCCERMLRMPQLVKYASVGTEPRHIFSLPENGRDNTTSETEYLALVQRAYVQYNTTSLLLMVRFFLDVIAKFQSRARSETRSRFGEDSKFFRETINTNEYESSLFSIGII